ncbi:MAG: hypothetical protein RQ757_03835 [Pseudomonadales bacterium]|nr:hypothetical protein [Pseudomonadales bacterium]
MSLVNDMLRDLDSRRRDAPGRGLQKLQPALDDGGRYGNRKLIKGLLLVLAVVLLGLSVWLLWPGLSSQSPRAVGIPLQVQSPVQPASPVDDSNAELTAVMKTELERINQRMRMLEEQNQTLREENEGASVAAAGVSQADPSRLVQAQPDQSQRVQTPLFQTEQSPWQNQEWAGAADRVVAAKAMVARPVPARTATVDSGSVDGTEGAANNTANNTANTQSETGSGLSISPRAMSFQEQDRQQVQQVLQTWQQGLRTQALQNLSSFIEANPAAHLSREMLAKLLLQQGDTIAAMQVADAGLALAPEHAGYKKIKARLMLTAGVPDDALALLERRAPAVSSDKEYHELLAAARMAARQYESALVTYQALAGLSQEESRYWYGMASSLDALGRNYEAQQAYQRALQLGNLSVGLTQLSQQRLLALRQN